MSRFHALRKQAEAVLGTAGIPCSVQRQTVTGQNAYGKPSYGWTAAGSVQGVLFYGSRRRSLSTDGTGRFRTEAPRLMVARGADLLEDDRVTVDGVTYRVDSITPFPTHAEAQLHLVNE